MKDFDGNEFSGKRCRTVGKRSVKRTVNQPGKLSTSQSSSSIRWYLDNEIEDFHLNSPPINITLRQQLEDMFKDRSSRYNFLDLSKISRFF